MHDDGYQHVEEDSGQVLDAMVEVVDGRLIWTLGRMYRGDKRVNTRNIVRV